MNASLRFRLVVAAFAAAALAGCTGGDGAEPTPTSSPYVAMARGRVDVEGGLVHVVAPRDGRVEDVRVGDGDTVKKGEVLALLDARAAKVDVDAAKASQAKADAEVAVLKAKLPELEQSSKRIGEAAGAGAATGQSADQAKSALDVLKAEIAAAEAAGRLARADVEKAEVELDARTLRAPVAGLVVRKDVHVGDSVSAASGTELFEILPDRPRIVRAELNEAYVDKVKAGMQAEVVRDSDQGQPVAARVLRVGEVFGPSTLTDDPVERASALDVECVLALDGGDFRIGQRVLVRFKR